MSDPYHPGQMASASSRDAHSQFTVRDLQLTANPGLVITTKYADDDQDDATHQVTCKGKGAEFSATVALTGSGPDRGWRTGWIQTIYPCSQSVTYQDPAGQRRGKVVSTLTSAKRDGDPPEHDALCIWYSASASSKPIAPGDAVVVKMDDQPNVPFHPVYAGRAAPWIKGWKAVETAGQKIFCSWLVAQAENNPGSGKEIVYLYFVAWTSDYGASLQDGTLAAVTGGAKITSQGPGKGNHVPCFDPIPVDEGDFPYEPDDALKAAQPPQQAAQPPFQGARPRGARGGVAITRQRQQPPPPPQPQQDQD